MTVMRKIILINNLLVLFCISCNKILPGEHAKLALENNSSETVYVSGAYLDVGLFDYQSKKSSIGVPKESCEVAPHSINYHVADIYGSGVAYSYEYVFSRTKTAEKCLVFVAPYYSTVEIGEYLSLFDYKLVCYELTYKDLVSLDFHLYFPPNEKMKNVKMDPPYEEVVEKYSPKD